MVRVSLCALLLALLVGLSHAVAVPYGVPYLLTFVITSGTYNGSDWQSALSSYLRSTYPAKFPSISNAEIMLYDVAQPTSSMITAKLALDPSTYDNVIAWATWTDVKMVYDMGDILPSKYAVINSTLVENAHPWVSVTFPVWSRDYIDSWSLPFYVVLNATPGVGKYMEFSINPNDADLTVMGSPVRITYPARNASFFLRGHVSKTFTGVTVNASGTDAAGRYTFDPNITNSFVVGPRENVTIQSFSGVEVYRNTFTPDITILAASHRDSDLSLIVTVIANHPNVTISPSANVSVTKRGVATPFRVSADIGTYTLTYLIAEPWVISGSFVAPSNSEFNSPTVSTVITFLDSLRINITRIPEAFLVNPPVTQSVYGGAFSGTVYVTLSKPPKSELIISPICLNATFIPTSVYFDRNTKSLSFIARGLSIGYHQVNFTLSGNNAAEYYVPPSQVLHVLGRNPDCHKRHTKITCRATPGCQWNALRSLCSNATLPIAISAIPLLFDEEPSPNITFTLPTPVENTLTVQLVPLGTRLQFTPSTFTLKNGETSRNFTIMAVLNQNDQWLSENFYLKLGGSDANVYDQQVATARLRPKVACVLTIPRAFFVYTMSGLFTITCDTAPTDDVSFVPVAQEGIRFVSSANNGSVMELTAGVKNLTFYLLSTSSRTGSIAVEFSVNGTSATKFDPPGVKVVTVLPSGEVLPPPSFHITAFAWSDPLHMDVTVVSPTPLYVAVTPRNLDWSVATSVNVTPPVVLFNETLRGFVTVYGSEPGSYVLTFNVTGLNANNYLEPHNVSFDVKDPQDGKAFEARLGVGFLGLMRCRVNVGRSSLRFKGQDPIDASEHLCDKYLAPPANQTFNCSSLPTEERCRNHLTTKGDVCVWHNAACIFLPQLQGNVSDVAYGSGFTLFLLKTGDVYSIGSTRYGQLGHYSTTLDRVPLNFKVQAIVAGTSHGMALTAEGYVYTWGANYKGQLGQNNRQMQTAVPGMITLPKGENVTCISSGTLHSGAITLSGRVYMWGANNYGQLGNRATFRDQLRYPMAIGRDVFGGDAAIAIQCGEYHTMVATDNAAYTFGSNTMGQLGREAYDAWSPGEPVLYVKTKFTSAPTYPSYMIGKKDC